MEVYIAHPANLDESEEFAIVCRGLDSTHLLTADAERAFQSDAKRIARLMVWLSTPNWAEAFAGEFAVAYKEFADYVDNADEPSLLEWVGEPIETLDVEVSVMAASA
jgi:hypothetical protein